MKNLILRIAMVLIYMSTVSISDALPKSNTPNGLSLFLDGKLTEPKEFIHVTNGRLTLVEHNSQSGAETELQFFAYLRRAGKNVDMNAYTHNFPVRNIELAEILKSAQVGDDIIIEPARKTDISGRKMIYVRYSMLFPVSNWFPFLSRKKGGC